MEIEQIQRRIEQLEQAQQEIRILKTTLEDALKEDGHYQEIDAQMRDLQQQKKKVTEDIFNQPTYQEAQAKIKEIKMEIRDIGDILNHELLAWRLEHDTDEIIGTDGTTRKLKINIRVSPPRNG